MLRYSQTQQAAQSTELLATTYRALIPLSFERSVTQVGLSIDTPLPAEFRKLLNEQRALSDAAFERLRSQFAQATAIRDSAAHLVALDQRLGEIRALRLRADHALGRLRAERGADAANLPRDLIATIDGLKAASNALRSSDILLAGRAMAQDVAADRLWRLREFGGRGRTHFAIAALHRSPIPSDTVAVMRELNGRVEQSWEAVQASRNGLPAGIQAAMSNLQAEYFTRYREVRAAMYAEQGSGNYPLSFEAFFARSGEAMRAAEQATLTAIDSAADAAKQALADALTDLIVQGLVALGLLAFAGLLTWFLLTRVARRIGVLTGAMERLAAGDTSVNVDAVAGRDEIGSMARAVGVFRANAEQIGRMSDERKASEERAQAARQAELQALAGEFETAIGSFAGQLSQAARTLTQSAGLLSDSAAETGRRSVGAQEATRSASTSAASVAAATEEMSSSIDEIGRQVSGSSALTSDAVVRANQAAAEIAALSASAERIGSVVEMISAIAAQTNLLALNATIEAARAGEAGRGFAVVASEVKQLADQTAKATAEISTQIKTVQAGTGKAVATIGEINTVIASIDSTVAAIAAAVEEQGATTREIAGNVSESSSLTSGLDRDMALIAADVGRTSEAATTVLASAKGVDETAAQLSQAMTRFVARIRAA